MARFNNTHISLKTTCLIEKKCQWLEIHLMTTQFLLHKDRKLTLSMNQWTNFNLMFQILSAPKNPLNRDQIPSCLIQCLQIILKQIRFQFITPYKKVIMTEAFLKRITLNYPICLLRKVNWILILMWKMNIKSLMYQRSREIWKSQIFKWKNHPWRRISSAMVLLKKQRKHSRKLTTTMLHHSLINSIQLLIPPLT